MAVTIKALAGELGVSPAVVSTVLNGKKYCGVSDIMRDKVLALAAKRDCCPNAAARTLRRGKSDLIGIIMPSPVIRFYAGITCYLQNILHSAGKNALFYFMDGGSTSEDVRNTCARMQSYGADGIILWNDISLKKISIPTVSYLEKNSLKTFKKDAVWINTASVVEQVGDFVSKHGGTLGAVSTAKDHKMQLFLKKNLCRPESLLFIQGDDPDAGKIIFEKISAMKKTDKTWFFSNAENLQSLAFELLRRKSRCLEELNFICYSGNAESMPPWMNVTFFKPFWQQLADAMTELLLHRIEHPDTPVQHRMISPEIDCGNSGSFIYVSDNNTSLTL